MQRKVLDFLFTQGGFTLFAIPDKSEFDVASLKKFALALNAGARFVLVDFSGEHFEGNAPISTLSLFQKELNEIDTEELSTAGDNVIISDIKALPKTDVEFRTFYHNLKKLQKIAPQVIGIVSAKDTENVGKLISIARVLIVPTASDTDTPAAFIEDVKEAQGIPLLWLSAKRPDRKKFPRANKAIRKNSTAIKEAFKVGSLDKPDDFCKVVRRMHKISILQKNPMDGIPKVFRRLFPLFMILAIAAPFLFVTNSDKESSNLRDRVLERNRLSVAPSFEYAFDGEESMQRIGRYALGRFSAIVTNEKILKTYVEQTLEENGFPVNSWENDKKNIPPKGTVIKFSRPDDMKSVSADSIGAAWKYWTSIFSDSISYLTEFYHETATAKERKHGGIDVASRLGSRILAPYAAKAWTSKDERGGIIIGLVREKDVLIFMHCDKLLYLDGQEVMQGDPIATVGTTGHTTGPHAHIVTGLLDKKGTKRIGKFRYNVIDPIKWFYMFKPTSMK